MAFRGRFLLEQTWRWEEVDRETQYGPNHVFFCWFLVFFLFLAGFWWLLVMPLDH